MNELLNDWKFWLFMISILKDFVLVLGIILIKVNDMKHMAEDIKQIQKNDEKIFRRLGKIEKLQASMKAVCNERHKNK